MIISRRKRTSGRNPADVLFTLDLQQLSDLKDDQVRSFLTALKGIGVWNTNI